MTKRNIRLSKLSEKQIVAAVIIAVAVFVVVAIVAMTQAFTD